MYTLYGYPKCSTCKKAEKWLQNQGFSVEVVDIVENTPDSEKIMQWMTETGGPIRRYYNVSGKRYRELGLKDKLDEMTLQEASDLLATDGMLLKRPILLKDGKFLVNGFKEEVYERIV